MSTTSTDPIVFRDILSKSAQEHYNRRVEEQLRFIDNNPYLKHVQLTQERLRELLGEAIERDRIETAETGRLGVPWHEITVKQRIAIGMDSIYHLHLDQLEKAYDEGKHDRLISLEHWINIAIRLNRNRCVEIVLDEYNIPNNLSYKDRIAYFQLMKGEIKNDF